jgi:hypothetical protein
MEAIRLAERRADERDAQQKQWQKEFATEQRAENVKAQKELVAEAHRSKRGLLIWGAVIGLVVFLANRLIDRALPPPPPAQTAPQQPRKP